MFHIEQFIHYMIQKPDSPERRQVARDMAMCSFGLTSALDLQLQYLRRGLLVTIEHSKLTSYFKLHTLQPRKHIDTFIFTTDLDSLGAFDEDDDEDDGNY